MQAARCQLAAGLLFEGRRLWREGEVRYLLMRGLFDTLRDVCPTRVLLSLFSL